MGQMQLVADHLGLPGLLRIGGHLIGENADAVPCAILVAASVQWHDHQLDLVPTGLNPFHAVDGGLVMERDGLPFLGSIGGGNEIENGAAVDGVAGIPASPNGDFAFAVAVQVGGGNADVILGGEIFGQDMLFPGRIFVPDKLFFIGQKNVRFAIAIDVRNGESVTDLDFGIDLDGAVAVLIFMTVWGQMDCSF
jgi:hypothetical protein